jgi:OOP family OmpA-OmpF porin
MQSRIVRLAAWMGAFTIILAVTLPAEADDSQFGQTREDFIGALKYPESPTGLRGKGGVRGLTLGVGAASEPEPMPADPPSVNVRVEFEFDSAELTPGARQVLDELGSALVSDELQAFRFRIVGHTDAVGTEQYNLQLSERRARAVENYLASRFGIGRDRLQSYGVGMNVLLDPDNPENAINRRVEITNLGRAGS